MSATGHLKSSLWWFHWPLEVLKVTITFHEVTRVTWNEMQFNFPPLQGKSLIWAVLMKIENVENIPHAMSHGHSLMNFFWSLSISRTSNGSRSQPPIYRQCARPAPDKDLQPTRQIVDDHSATTPSSFNLNSIRETSALLKMGNIHLIWKIFKGLLWP